jgi:hypothetical protein
MTTIVLLVAALVCFILAAFGLHPRVNLGWIGAALITITLIIGSWPGVNS